MQPVVSSRLFSSSSPRDLCDDVFILPSVLWRNRQTIARLVLRLKPKKLSQWFWSSNHQTVAVGFETQTGKPGATDFEVKLGETIDLGFEAKPRNLRFSSPCAWCRPHTASSNLSIVWSPSTRPVLDHPQPSTPGLLFLPWSSLLPTISHLSPTHHETSNRDSPHKITE
jgi:hypothetical protein